jgi:hypothetical protein
MDTQEAISWAARMEAARGLRPLTDDAEVADLVEAGEALPVIEVARDPATGRLTAVGRGHEGHDNEGRMAPVCDFLQRRVLPFVEPGLDVRGGYRIELHDSYSYLPRERRVYDNAMTFSRPRAARERSVVVPDPYQMAAYGGMLSVPDTVPWGAKRPTLFFAGTTTGDRDPVRNERIAACRWALSQPRDVADFRITCVAQMTAANARAKVPCFDELLHPQVPHTDHFEHRYQVNIAGNTACWSRVPMVLASGSLMVQLRTHQDMAWYYPFLRQDEHYVGALSLDALPSVRQWCMANEGACQQMVARASRFVLDYLSPMHAALYWLHLLEAAAANR